MRIYPEIIRSLDRQGLEKKIEYAKAIRRQWIKGRIHPGLYYELRQETLRRTGIDV